MLKRSAVALTVLALLVGAGAAQAETAKNVILMISDGLGMNGWEASSYYLYDQAGSSAWHEALPYGTDKGFDMYGCTHYMLNGDGSEQGYDPVAMWESFNYTKGDDNYEAFTDSAAAATALYTGTKTYKGAVGVDFNKNRLTGIAEYADMQGKATGAVSSVQLSHATPAAVFAHNEARGNYADIANEMIYNSPADVIMGCGEGHSSNKYVGGHDTWADITDADGANGFQYVADVADFQALADGTYDGGALPGKVLGIPHTTYTLKDEYAPGLNDETVVPTLATMTKGALNVLSQDEDGFFLMVEGGAVDWENHGQGFQQMLYEQKDFDDSVQAAMEWIDANGGYEENLLIITSDHECGMIWGEGTWTDIDDNGKYDEGVDEFHGFMGPTDKGPGVLPGVQYGSYGHTNQLVPLFVQGVGAEEFAKLVDTDTGAGAFWDFDGRYVDNTDVFTVMNQVVPEPTTMALLGIGGLAAIRRRRR